MPEGALARACTIAGPTHARTHANLTALAHLSPAASVRGCHGVKGSLTRPHPWCRLRRVALPPPGMSSSPGPRGDSPTARGRRPRFCAHRGWCVGVVLLPLLAPAFSVSLSLLAGSLRLLCVRSFPRWTCEPWSLGGDLPKLLPWNARLVPARAVEPHPEKEQAQPHVTRNPVAASTPHSRREIHAKSFPLERTGDPDQRNHPPTHAIAISHFTRCRAEDPS